MPTVTSTAPKAPDAPKHDHIEVMEWGKERLIRVVVVGYSAGRKTTSAAFFRRQDLQGMRRALDAVEGGAP